MVMLLHTLIMLGYGFLDDHAYHDKENLFDDNFFLMEYKNGTQTSVQYSWLT